MDNERTPFENRCFYSLFSKGDVVDATGVPYARLCLKVAQTISGVKEMYTRRAPLYAAFADITVDNDGPVEDTVYQIIKELERR